MSSPNIFEDLDLSVLASDLVKSDLQDGAEPGLNYLASTTTDDEGIRLVSLLPLLEHVPGLNLEEDRGTYYIRGRISSSDQSALILFARRVIELKLSVTVENGRKLSPGIFVKLATLSNLLFPCLDRLYVESEDIVLDSLEIFLTPSLRSMTFLTIGQHLESSLTSSIATLKEVAPALDSLSFRDCSVSMAVFDSLSAFEHLTRLELINSSPEITHSLIEDIGKIKTLESLVFQAASGQSYQRSANEGSTGSSDRFMQLKRLSLSGKAKFIEDFLKHVSSYTLEAIGLSFLDISPSSRFSPAVQIVVDKWINTVVVVIIKVSLPVDLNNETFTQMIQSPVLMHLDIDSKTRVSRLCLCLRGLHEISSSSLLTLYLPVGRLIDGIDASTFSLILDVCPNLKRFRCTLQIEDQISFPELPRSHKLKALFLDNHEDCPNHAARLVSRFFDSSCPYLKEFTMVGLNIESEVGHGWRQVYENLRMCQESRADERKRRGVGRVGLNVGEESDKQSFVILSPYAYVG